MAAEEGIKKIANVSRRPSVHRDMVPLVSRAPPKRSYSPSSEDSFGEGPPDPSLLRWGADDIADWLRETGYEQYQDDFRGHAITSGRILLNLCEGHLKDMGVTKVGHRLEILGNIDELRKRAGLVSKEVFTDINVLIDQMDAVRSKHHLHLYPKRIILIRHAESQGNVDRKLYASVPDSQLEITEKGKQQAYAAGVKLKQLVGVETVTFYVSPFLRSRQTYEGIRQSLHDEQVLYYREDPRLREQEWGNFQDPEMMEEIMKERREIGAFYYRFPTGESGADVFDRVSTFLETFYRDMKKGSCGENAVFVSHGLFCRLFLTRYFHWKIEAFHKLWNFKNCQFAIMELQPGGHYKLVTELTSDP